MSCVMFNAMQKLVEEFIKRVDAGIRREIHYWHAYYVSSILLYLKYIFEKLKVHRVTTRRSAGEKAPSWNDCFVKIRR